MKFNPGILRAYDIRGEYNKDFDDEFAERLGGALVTYFDAKKLILARDMRPSALPLREAIIRGITGAGCDVVDIGESSTPFFYYAVISGSAPAGIMITASHMGEAFNGFKICKKDAMVLGKESGLLELAEIIRGEPIFAETIGNIAPINVLNDHAEHIIKYSGPFKGEVDLKVAVEAAPMIRKELGVIFDKLGIMSVNVGYDVKFAFDPDGDRLMIYNSQNKQIRADLFEGLLAQNMKEVIADLRASRGVTDYLIARGTKLIPSKIGHTNIKRVMKENDVEFAGEASGHLMFRELNYSESTQLGILKILKLLSEEKKTIDELVAPLDVWAYSGEINAPIAGWPDSVAPIVAKLKAQYADGALNEIDGLRVDYPDWWFLVRASGTEPVIRLIVEARTKDTMDEKIKEVQALIAS